MEACQRLSHRERNATPEPFRDLLIAMAGTVKMKSETGPCTHPQGESECPVCRWLSVPITAKTTTRKSLLNEKRTP